MSAATAVPAPVAESGARQRASGGGVINRRRGTVATVIMVVLALAWLFPLLWSLYNSFRDYSYTQTNGYLSFGGWTLENYEEAWSRGNFGLHFKNSLIITVPAVALTLFLSSATWLEVTSATVLLIGAALIVANIATPEFLERDLGED